MLFDLLIPLKIIWVKRGSELIRRVPELLELLLALCELYIVFFLDPVVFRLGLRCKALDLVLGLLGILGVFGKSVQVFLALVKGG